MVYPRAGACGRRPPFAANERRPLCFVGAARRWGYELHCDCEITSRRMICVAWTGKRRRAQADLIVREFLAEDERRVHIAFNAMRAPWD
ncbi:MAG: hypothetical protein WKF84_22210 [Pyrinomonadaceae bacterium]